MGKQNMTQADLEALGFVIKDGVATRTNALKEQEKLILTNHEGKSILDNNVNYYQVVDKDYNPPPATLTAPVRGEYVQIPADMEGNYVLPSDKPIKKPVSSKRSNLAISTDSYKVTGAALPKSEGYYKEKAIKANKKIKNATKVEYDGIKFDSRLEGNFYKMLKAHNIPFELKKVFLLQEGFVYRKKRIRPITMIPDFYLEEHNMIVDTKGYATQTATMKFKMLKYSFYNNDSLSVTKHPEIVIVKNKSQSEKLINRLLSK